MKFYDKYKEKLKTNSFLENLLKEELSKFMSLKAKYRRNGVKPQGLIKIDLK